MPPSNLSVKTRSRLNDLQRKEIYLYQQEHPSAKQQDIVNEFQIRYPNLKLGRSTVSKVPSKKDYYLHLEATNRSQTVFRHRKPKYPALELALNHWIGQVLLVDYAPSHTTAAAGDNHGCVNDPQANHYSSSSESDIELETPTRGCGRPRLNRNTNFCDFRGDNTST